MGQMARTVRLLSVLLLAVVCAGCRVDVDINVRMDSKGAGSVTVTLVTDKEMVTRAPGLATDLRLEDIKAAGWTVTGPTVTPDGGLQVELVQAFTTPAQANAILADLNGPNGPLVGITLALTTVQDTTTYTLNGRLQVVGGLAAFSDTDLVTALGSAPYAAQVAAAGQQPKDVLGITFKATMPGKLNTTTAKGSAGLQWTVPLDGTALDVGTLSEHTVARNKWAKPVAKSAQVALVTWGAVSIGFILYVIAVRHRRRRLARN